MPNELVYPNGWKLQGGTPSSPWQLISPSGAHVGWIYDECRGQFEALISLTSKYKNPLEWLR
jgi:hypothetical protein